LTGQDPEQSDFIGPASSQGLDQPAEVLSSLCHFAVPGLAVILLQQTAVS